jgi:hypothetical protein
MLTGRNLLLFDRSGTQRRHGKVQVMAFRAIHVPPPVRNCLAAGRSGASALAPLGYWQVVSDASPSMQVVPFAQSALVWHTCGPSPQSA